MIKKNSMPNSKVTSLIRFAAIALTTISLLAASFAIHAAPESMSPEAMYGPSTVLQQDRTGVGTPTWALTIARATVDAVKSGAEGRSGIYNLTATGSVTRADFAQRLFERTAARSTRAAPRVVRVTSDEFPAPAARPPNSVLDTAKIVRTFGVALRDWDADLGAFVDTLG